METSKLLDPNIDYFIIQNDDTYYADARIEDHEHNIIGKIKQKGDLHKHILLLDSNNSIILESDKNPWTISDTYEVKDSEGKIIGIVKKKMTWRSKLEMRMENPNDEIILISKGPFDYQFYEIKSNDGGKIIGKFGWKRRKGFFNILLSNDILSSTILQITDTSYDRKTLLGFFICLYNQIIEDQNRSYS